MKLALFGATGGTGRQLLDQALARGDELSALVRDPTRLTRTDARLHVVTGDVHDPEAVRQTIVGTEAVIGVLGPRRGSGKRVLATGARNITTAMLECGVRRLVVLSITAVRDPEDRPRVTDRLLEGVGRVVASGVYADHRDQAAVLRAAALDWTIVRAPFLSNGPHTGRYRVGYLGGGVGARISRPDVAEFLLRQVGDTTYLHRLPLVGS